MVPSAKESHPGAQVLIHSWRTSRCFSSKCEIGLSLKFSSIFFSLENSYVQWPLGSRVGYGP